MNVRVLIDNIVRQTTVLIAQLATAAGLRAPLAHIANQVFLDLTRRLEADGLGRKVIADMFGLALRSYQLKVQRLAESATERNQTLWQALLSYLRDQGVVTRHQVIHRFRHDDEATVRGVLHDLVDSGLVFKSGRGDGTTYRALTAEDLSRAAREDTNEESVAALVWVTLHRLGRATKDELAGALVIDDDALDDALEALVREGRAQVVEPEVTGSAPIYSTINCTVPLGATVGWEAAVFDHYQAMVSAVCAKLDAGETRARVSDQVGGSTYHFDVWSNHPNESRVRELFAKLRTELSALRKEVSAFSEANTPPPEGATRHTLYLGQLVREEVMWSGSGREDEG